MLPLTPCDDQPSSFCFLGIENIFSHIQKLLGAEVARPAHDRQVAGSKPAEAIHFLRSDNKCKNRRTAKKCRIASTWPYPNFINFITTSLWKYINRPLCFRSTSLLCCWCKNFPHTKFYPIRKNPVLARSSKPKHPTTFFWRAKRRKRRSSP